MTAPAASPPSESPQGGPSVDVPKQRKTRTLWWLLGVLVIGLFLAVGIAVGVNWWRRISRNEIGAVGSCRAYAEAQCMSRSGSGDLPYVDYCHPYTELVTRKGRDGKPMELISRGLAAGRGLQGVPHHGYLFQDLKTIGGKPIDWVDDFGLCATPAKHGVTGRRTFILDTKGTVWGKNLGKSDFVKDFPANPQAAGWRIAE